MGNAAARDLLLSVPDVSWISINNVKAQVWGVGSSQIRPLIMGISLFEFSKVLLTTEGEGAAAGCASCWLCELQSKLPSKNVESLPWGNAPFPPEVGLTDCPGAS